MMFRFIKSKITMKRVVIVSISIPIFMAAQQGIELRQKYNKRQRLHLPPTNSGIEKWKTKIINFKDGIRERFTQAQQQAHDDDEKTIINNIRFVLKDIQTKVKSRIGIDNHESNTDGKLNKIKSWMENILKKKSFVKLESGVTSSSPSSSSNKMKGDNKMNPVPSSSSGSPLSQKKIKLLIIGDSLVSGVGCTNAEAPTLVKTIAQTLSATLGVDIEWKSAGVVGGTTSDIRMQLLPALKRDFLAVKEEDKLNTEIIAIVICGLNDWKSMLEQFPFGAGPARFRQELKDLLNELQTDIDVPCRVFIPAIPLTCGMTDSTFVFNARPLTYFVQTLFAAWDYQKIALIGNSRKRINTNVTSVTNTADDDSEENEDFIDENPLVINDQVSFNFVTMPNVNAAYATPGEGNVCSDGVHPSSKGYSWWALHICEAILSSRL